MKLRFLVHQEVDVHVDGDYEITDIEAELGKSYPGFFIEYLRKVKEPRKQKTNFKEGQLIVYKGANGYEVGKIKEIREDNKAVTWYHEGDTAALTELSLVSPLINDYCIQEVIGKDSRKFYLKYKPKFYDDKCLQDIYLNYSYVDSKFELDKKAEDLDWKTKFSKEDIDYIKRIYQTDLADFEMIEVEE